ncbi:MAG TPA: glycoside hydrolase family 20 zincin-like fold domain-containing protein [archaeon]|nr:glycoside hydrolase family 20 zincin-like fold domain-containing protein [archaeon]
MGIRTAFLLALISLIILPAVPRAADFPVYPLPQEIELTAGRFDLTQAEIIIFNGQDDKMAYLARYLSRELAARYEFSITWHKAREIARKKPEIVLGLSSDPEILKSLAEAGLGPDSVWEAPESYRLIVTPALAVIAGHDPRGLFYGIQSFIQLIESPEPGQGYVKGARISDKPFKPVRGVHVYLPARKDIPFFKNFIKTMALFKVNTLIIEVGGGMRLDKHPEINIAWENFCRAFYDMGDPFLKYGEQVPLGPQGRFQASVHTELSGGSWLSKEEVKEIVEFARDCQMNVVPEIQSLTHTYYLVLAHREIAEIPEAAWPDSYDPSNPGSYELLFDVIDEYLEVFKPEWVHIGHDEWRAGIKGETGKLYAEDVLKIYRYLKSRGVRTMMWADHLVKGHNAERRVPEPPAEGVWYAYPSTEGAAEIISKEAKDILMLNWSWGVAPSSDNQLKSYGWQQIFGNFSGAVQYGQWQKRLSQEDVLGAEMSTWCLANEFSYGQNGNILNMLLSQNLLWSKHAPPLEELYEYLALKMPEIRELLSGSRLPSLELKRKRAGYSFVPVNIASSGNSGRMIWTDVDLSRIPSGKINYNDWPFLIGEGEKAFTAVQGAGDEVRNIPVESNAASLLFLHLSTGKETKHNTYFSNYPEDTAELLGYYRVRYEDGFEETVPIRYGRNISQYGGDFSDQLYFAHTIKLSEDTDGRPVLAYAYEWVNPRPNRLIKSIDLVGVEAKSGVYPVLLALTVVKPPFTE